MASKFTKEEFDLYMPAFKEFDTNGDGQITAKEFEVRNILVFSPAQVVFRIHCFLLCSSVLCRDYANVELGKVLLGLLVFLPY